MRATATKARRIVGQRRKEMTERNFEALVDLYLEGEERADVDRELEQDNAELRALPSGGADLYGSRYPRAHARLEVEQLERTGLTMEAREEGVCGARRSCPALSAVPAADGLVWTSSQCDPDDACLFFGNRVRESDFTAVQSRDGASDKSFVKDVRDEDRRRGIALTI